MREIHGRCTHEGSTWTRNVRKPWQVERPRVTPGKKMREIRGRCTITEKHLDAEMQQMPPCRDVTPASFHETQGNAGAVKIDTDDLNLYMLVQLQDF